MKKFLLSLVIVAFAASVSMAQAPVKPAKAVAPKHEKCESHKDGKACDKPAELQCDDCKAAAQKHECKEGKQCEKAAGMKHECKEGKQCEKAAGMKHECKEGKQCEKPAGMKHECKEGEGKQCDKGAIKKMHQECKDHQDGKPCNKPADQQCPDCKEKAKKN